jgi:hypothetical protein
MPWFHSTPVPGADSKDYPTPPGENLAGTPPENGRSARVNGQSRAPLEERIAKITPSHSGDAGLHRWVDFFP